VDIVDVIGLMGADSGVDHEEMAVLMYNIDNQIRFTGEDQHGEITFSTGGENENEKVLAREANLDRLDEKSAIKIKQRKMSNQTKVNNPVNNDNK
jgi:hypothetical protein